MLTHMCSQWSRTVFSKILGVGFLFCGVSEAAQYDRAFEAAQRAFFVQSGLKQKLEVKKKETLSKVKGFLKEEQVLEEAAMIGGILQIVRERGLKVKYNGVDYIITPTQLRVIIYLFLQLGEP